MRMLPPAAAAASGPAASGKRKIKSTGGTAKDDVDDEEPEQKSQRGGKAKGGAKKVAKSGAANRGAAAAAAAVPDVDAMGLGTRERQKVFNAMAAAESLLTEGGPLRPPQTSPLLGQQGCGAGGLGPKMGGWGRACRPGTKARAAGSRSRAMVDPRR